MSTNLEIADLYNTKRISKAYSQYRPTYPPILLEKIISFLEKKMEPPYMLAVDVACGTGKSTRLLADHFRQVIGVDISPTQIAEANALEKLPNVTFKLAAAESLPVGTNSVDLITVGNGIHWLEDLDVVYSEFNRVLKPGGCLAVYAYDCQWMLLHFGNKTEALSQFYHKTLFDTCRSYWRWDLLKLAVDHYRYLRLPYKECERYDDMTTSDEITVAGLMGYTVSLSFLEKYNKDHPEDTTFLQRLQDRIMAILDVDTPPEETIIRRELPLFMCVTRKPL